MKKINIIKKERDFDRIIKKNKPYKNKYFLFFVSQNIIDTYRFGISVSTKVGNAVIRNKIKRQIKNILDMYKNKFKKGFDCIIIVDRRIVELDFNLIKSNLEDLIYKIDLLEEEKTNDKK